MDIISIIFLAILGIITSIVNLLMLPIDALIAVALPQLATLLTSIGDFLDIVASGLGWAISATGIPYPAIALLGTFFIFKLTLPINVWAVKLGINWWHQFK